MQDRPFEAHIVSFSPSGDGIARVAGDTLYVPGGIPGDHLRVRFRGKNSKGRAEIDAVLSPSKSRVDPACEGYQQGCGGCPWLSVDYQEQLRWKNILLEKALTEVEGIPFPLPPVIGMANPSGCRNKFSLLNQNGELVFTEGHSRDVLKLRDCPQEMDGNRELYRRLQGYRFPEEVLQVHLRCNPEGQTGINLFVKHVSAGLKKLAQTLVNEIPGLVGIAASSYREASLLAGKPLLEQKLNGHVFRISHNGFFQTNPEQAAKLQKLALSKLGKGHSLLDLYCGAGFFSIPAAESFEHVVGVENSEDSIRGAIHNASKNGADHAEFIAADVRPVIRTIPGGKFTHVLLDPPRDGCGPEVAHGILRLAPETIVYVSCSPESLGQDLQILTQGPYRVTFCQGVDMFPHTPHLECVVKLEKIENGACNEPHRKGKDARRGTLPVRRSGTHPGKNQSKETDRGFQPKPRPRRT